MTWLDFWLMGALCGLAMLGTVMKAWKPKEPSRLTVVGEEDNIIYVKPIPHRSSA